MNKPITYCATIYPAGRTIEIHSKHQEWTDWAANACNSHAAMVEALHAAQIAMSLQRQIERGRGDKGAEGWNALIEAAGAALAHTAQEDV